MTNALPDYYPTVAEDVIAFCGGQGGRVWVDLGSDPGGLGLALLEKIPAGAMTLMGEMGTHNTCSRSPRGPYMRQKKRAPRFAEGSGKTFLKWWVPLLPNGVSPFSSICRRKRENVSQMVCLSERAADIMLELPDHDLANFRFCGVWGNVPQSGELTYCGKRIREV